MREVKWMVLNNTYQARLGQHGTNATERLNKGREENFKRFLAGSPHAVSFSFGGSEWRAVLEPFRQDETKTLMHLLTAIEFQPSIGSILYIEGDNWMVYWLDEHKNKGYNRWVLIRMSREVTWYNNDKSEHSSLAYIYGQQDNMLKNEIKSRSRSAALYQENLKLYFMVMPANQLIEYGSYLVLEEGLYKQHFRVTGYDFLSTPGVVYVSIDPTLPQDSRTDQDVAEPSEDDPWLGGFLDD